MLKKAQTSPRKPISLFMGLAFIILGVLPILNLFGIVSFTLPAIPQIVLYVLSVVGGVILLWDAISESQMGSFGITGQIMFASYIGAVAVLALGLIPLLNTFGVIGFALPGFVGAALDFVFAFIGLLLLFGGVQGF